MLSYDTLEAGHITEPDCSGGHNLSVGNVAWMYSIGGTRIVMEHLHVMSIQMNIIMVIMSMSYDRLVMVLLKPAISAHNAIISIIIMSFVLRIGKL